MKKTVKSLIIAASVAAVAGIGAVSFAAWQGGNTTNATQTGTTGNVAVIGTLAVSGATGFDNLVPYDQQTQNTADSDTYQYDASTMSLMASVIVTYTADTNANGDDVLTYSIDKGDSTLTLKYTVTAAAETAPANDATWTAIGATATEMANFESGQKVFIRLESTTTADMNERFTITFTVEAEKAAA